LLNLYAFQSQVEEEVEAELARWVVSYKLETFLVERDGVVEQSYRRPGS
jgi:hypothetical protein